MKQTNMDIFTSMFQSVLVDLKASPQLLENICLRAVKLSTHLNSLANCLGLFIDAMQSISDNANNTNGANRDIGASLTRFCLRQRSLENLLRAFATTLSENFAPAVEKKMGEWRQRVSEIERRRTRYLKKWRHKSIVGSELTCESRNAFAELLAEQRNQFVFFVNALLPTMNAQLEVLDENAHIREVRDLLASAANENDAQAMVEVVLEDAQICATTAAEVKKSGTDSCKNSAEDLWQQRISSCNAGALLKSASQYLQKDAQANCFSTYNQSQQQLPSSSSSVSSSGHDSYGTMHSSLTGTIASGSSGGRGTATGFNELTKNNNQQLQQFSFNRLHTLIASSPERVGGTEISRRRAPISAQTFTPTNELTSQQQSGKTSSMANSLILKPPPPIRQRDLIYSVPLRNNSTSSVGTCFSLSTSDISSLGPLSSEIAANDVSIVGNSADFFTERAAAVNNVGAAGTIRRGRPLSCCEDLPDKFNGVSDFAKNDRHSSTLIIAETLQQIDQLGMELDSYCQTLKPALTNEIRKGLQINESNQHAINTHSQFQIVDNSSSGVGSSSSVSMLEQQNLPHCTTVSALTTAACANSDNATYYAGPTRPSTWQFSGNSRNVTSGNVRYRPDNIRLPPPLPERRNSTITAATPTAPSIVDVRNSSGSYQFQNFIDQKISDNLIHQTTQQRSVDNNGDFVGGSPVTPMNLIEKQQLQSQQQQTRQLRSSQKFDQYNQTSPPPPHTFSGYIG